MAEQRRARSGSELGGVPDGVLLAAEGVVGHRGVAGGPVDRERRCVATGLFGVVLTHKRWTPLDHSAAQPPGQLRGELASPTPAPEHRLR